MKKILLTIVSICVSCAVLRGAGAKQFVVDFNPSDGLPDINISCISQDSFNRIWVGTKRGVYYYSGYGFLSLQNKDYLSHCSQNISMIAIDSCNRLWIFSEKGSGFYDIPKDEFTPVPKLTGVTVTDFDFDKKGNAWITSSEGLIRYSADDSSFTIEIDHSYLNSCKCCVSNDDEIVITANDDNLYFYNYNNRSLRSVKIDKASSLGLIEQSGPNDYIVSDGETTVRLVHLEKQGEDSREYVSNYPVFESSASISCILNAGNSIWVGTSYGLQILDNNSGEYERRDINNSEGTTLGGENIISLFKDLKGNIWVGTYNSGLRCCIYDEGFNRYVSDGQPNSLRGTSIRAICDGLENEVWTGSEEGYLCRFDTVNKSFTDYSAQSGIPYGSAITDIDYFNNLLWISTYGSGVFLFDPESRRQVKHYELPVNKCMSINNTSIGNIYVGTNNGLFVLDSETDKFEFVDIIGDVFIHDVYEDSHGRCWISSYGKGLAFIDLDTSEYFTITKDVEGNELDAQNIINLSEDSDGAIWIGTDTGILSRIVIDDSNSAYQITNYDINSDMAPVCISGIVDGGGGKLWVATTHGLVYFDSVKGKKEMTYLQNDNIVGSNLCYGGEFIDKDGLIYFGTSKGIVIFDPDSVLSKYAHSKLYITDIIATSHEDRRSASTQSWFSAIATDRIRIHQKDAQQILITYSAMNYIDPTVEEVECVLTKSGIRNHVTTERPYLTYYGLRPGKYQFSVNYLDSEESDLGSSIQIQIISPWYSSTVAKILYCIFLLLAVLFFLSYYRKKQILENERLHQLDEARKEKNLAQEKINFMTNVTHEIRTPVSIILILLEKLSHGKDIPKNIQDGLEAITINAEKLRKYCNDILDLRKTDNGRAKLNIKNENISDIVSDSVHAFSSAIAAKGIKIETTLPEKEIMVSCDHEAVETIICNLLSNAIKYSQNYIKVYSETGPDVIRIKVDSDGEHIAIEDSEKIFDAFYQVQRPDNYGTGVGLTFSRQLALMHNGKLYLDTTNSEMNSFVLELPLNESCSESQVPSSAATGTESVKAPFDEVEEEITDDNVRVLVVEDNDMMRNLLKEELEKQYDVCCAADGEEALGIVKKKRIDLVVSDIMMPKMDGCELCNAIKEDIELSHIPVLLLTAAVGAETNLRSLKVGADAYIEKPFRMDILMAQINNLFKNRDIRNKQFATSPLAHINCSSANKKEYDFVNMLHDYIIDHIAEPELSIDRLAGEMSMSKASLSRKVKANTGLTVNEYVRICRLKKAVELLYENDYRINEVAYLVGYSSASYFTKIFQKQFGKLPSEFIQGNYPQEP